MKTFKVDSNTILEETDMIVIRNFPPSNMTYSYIQRVFRQYKKNSLSCKDVLGEPIYFHDLTHEQLALAIIMANAQNALLRSIPIKEDLTEIKK